MSFDLKSFRKIALEADKTRNEKLVRESEKLDTDFRQFIEGNLLVNAARGMNALCTTEFFLSDFESIATGKGVAKAIALDAAKLCLNRILAKHLNVGEIVTVTGIQLSSISENFVFDIR